MERSADVGGGIEDAEYESQGASILAVVEEVFGESEVIMKVKEPLEREYALLNQDRRCLLTCTLNRTHT